MISVFLYFFFFFFLFFNTPLSFKDCFKFNSASFLVFFPRDKNEETNGKDFNRKQIQCKLIYTLS